YGLMHRDHLGRLIESESGLKLPHQPDTALLRDARGVAPYIRQTVERRLVIAVFDRSGRGNGVYANVGAADIGAHLDITPEQIEIFLFVARHHRIHAGEIRRITGNAQAVILQESHQLLPRLLGWVLVERNVRWKTADLVCRLLVEK